MGSKREVDGNLGRGDCRRSPQPASIHCRNPSYSGAQLACEPPGVTSLAPSFLHFALLAWGSGLSRARSKE